MSQYILLSRVKIQDANAIAGMAWGFPAITGFLGFVHALSLKLKKSDFAGVSLDQKVMITSHEFEHQTYVNDYQITRFSQRRGANIYSDTKSDKKDKTMTRIEEGRMDLTISMLIPIKGRVSANKKDSFTNFIERIVQLMRIASGSVLEIGSIELLALDESNPTNKILLKRKLTPGFILQDCPDVLQKHFESEKTNKPAIDLVDAWLDFCALKYKARPVKSLIDKYLVALAKRNDSGDGYILLEMWQKHLQLPYQSSLIPDELHDHFSKINTDDHYEMNLQWQKYCHPDEKTKADWEHVAKPANGYLVPLMIGYRQISESCNDIDNLRGVHKSQGIDKWDFENAYFVEALYGVGKWIFSNQIDFDDFSQYFWEPAFCNKTKSYCCASNINN
jgi:CRISPR-associated protein Csy2